MEVLCDAETHFHGSCGCRVESEAGEFVRGRIGVDADWVERDQFSCTAEEETAQS